MSQQLALDAFEADRDGGTEGPVAKLDNLAPAQRRDARAVLVEGLAVGEQADAAGVAVATVSRNVTRAVERLDAERGDFPGVDGGESA